MSNKVVNKEEEGGGGGRRRRRKGRRRRYTRARGGIVLVGLRFERGWEEPVGLSGFRFRLEVDWVVGGKKEGINTLWEKR